MVAAESLEESGPEPARGAEPVGPIEPTRVQGLPAERELREAVELSLPRGPAELSEQVAGATEVAAAGSVRETRGDATEACGWHCELLRDSNPLWRSRGGQRKHSHADQPGPRLPEPSLHAPEGKTHGNGQRGIHRGPHGPKSRLNGTSCRI